MKHIEGRHLIIDAYVRDGSVLENPDALCHLFDTLVDELGMEYLQRPAAYRVPTAPERLENDEDDGGWSVICQITTSHIALHGWPLRRAFMMDVFSCHDFDANAAQRIIWQHLGVTEANVQDIRRTDPRQVNLPETSAETSPQTQDPSGLQHPPKHPPHRMADTLRAV